MSASIARIAKELLHFHPYETTLVQMLQEETDEATLNFVNSNNHGLLTNEIGMKCISFSYNASLHLVDLCTFRITSTGLYGLLF